MRVVITGGTGFIGLRLAREILARGELTDQHGKRREVNELVLFDIAAPDDLPDDNRLKMVVGEVTDPATVETLLGSMTDSIFHLAAVVSGAAEADHQLGLRVNLDGTRVMLDVAAASGRKPKFIFASSLAVYGGPEATKVTDATLPAPMSSYGTQKLIGEALVGDYDRRGLIDGRALRFPTVAVRPGKANAANSSFISAVIREPVAGRQTVSPVPDDVPIALISPGRLVDAILKAHNVPTEDYGWPRALVLPAFRSNVADMLAALDAVSGPELRKLVRTDPDPRIEPMVRSWPAEVTSARAAALGIETDASAREIVEQYVSEFGLKG